MHVILVFNYCAIIKFDIHSVVLRFNVHVLIYISMQARFHMLTRVACSSPYQITRTIYVIIGISTCCTYMTLLYHVLIVE